MPRREATGVRRPAAGLLTPELEPIALRFVRLGVVVAVFAVLALGPVGLLVTEDVQSVPAFVGLLVALLAIAGVVERHDWASAIAQGRASRHAEWWAYAVLVVTTTQVLVAIPRSGSWLYHLVIAGYFAVLLPVRPAARVLVAALAGLVVAEALAAGTGAPQVLTAAVGVTMVAAVAHATAEVVVRVVGESDRRAQMLATVAQSSRAVASLDPDEVPRRVADAGIQLGFDAILVSEVGDDHHRVMVERSRIGPVFRDPTMPIGPMVEAVVRERRTHTRDRYLQGPSPNPHLLERGIDAVAVSPVIVEGEVVAVLVGGRTAPRLDPAQTEAFTLLGELLAQSLANARRFERERAAVATLDALGRLKDDLVSNVSHELRTPITVITGSLQTLDRRGPHLPEEVRARLFRSAVSNGEVLQATLESLLEFSRAEQGRRTDEQRHEVDVAEVVRGSAERLESLLVDHDLHLDVPRPAVVPVVPDQLDRVVDNLLLNAARHTPEGTRVHVRVRGGPGGVRVEVADDGPGIDPGDVPHLTDRFFRGGESTTRSTRGLGLGLALVQRILVAHDSRLQVDSTPGEGTCFWFDLPPDPRQH